MNAKEKSKKLLTLEATQYHAICTLFNGTLFIARNEHDRFVLYRFWHGQKTTFSVYGTIESLGDAVRKIASLNKWRVLPYRHSYRNRLNEWCIGDSEDARAMRYRRREWFADKYDFFIRTVEFCENDNPFEDGLYQAIEAFEHHESDYAKAIISDIWNWDEIYEQNAELEAFAQGESADVETKDDSVYVVLSGRYVYTFDYEAYPHPFPTESTIIVDRDNSLMLYEAHEDYLKLCDIVITKTSVVRGEYTYKLSPSQYQELLALTGKTISEHADNVTITNTFKFDANGLPVFEGITVIFDGKVFIVDKIVGNEIHGSTKGNPEIHKICAVDECVVNLDTYGARLYARIASDTDNLDVNVDACQDVNDLVHVLTNVYDGKQGRKNLRVSQAELIASVLYSFANPIPLYKLESKELTENTPLSRDGIELFAGQEVYSSERFQYYTIAYVGRKYAYGHVSTMVESQRKYYNAMIIGLHETLKVTNTHSSLIMVNLDYRYPTLKNHLGNRENWEAAYKSVLTRFNDNEVNMSNDVNKKRYKDTLGNWYFTNVSTVKQGGIGFDCYEIKVKESGGDEFVIISTPNRRAFMFVLNLIADIKEWF